ncbi:hypothetical protein L1987_16947 [Smallanthus sonchifolius]|uniref:Uncharacterized protein n=1 Tax=Smallanthus sonchifolius TaxID=185202 RepID=A0ACB9IY08_9ASTR|nr:hypothetical protein L1987_16947 [Smallanthus sonchifolius]
MSPWLRSIPTKVVSECYLVCIEHSIIVAHTRSDPIDGRFHACKAIFIIVLEKYLHCWSKTYQTITVTVPHLSS